MFNTFYRFFEMKASFLSTELLEEILDVAYFNLIFSISKHSSGASVSLESALSQVGARVGARSFGKGMVLLRG